MAGTSSLFAPISEQELTQRIHVALDPLLTSGITITGVTSEAIFGFGFTIGSFEKHVSVLKSLMDRKTAQNFLVTCRTKNLIASAFELNLKEIDQICAYLRTSEGQATLRSIQRLEKLDKLGHGVYGAKDVAWRKIFEVQCSDLGNKSKLAREASDKEIAELKAQLAAAEERKNKAQEKLKKSHPVAASFAWPPIHEVARRAWELYVADCGKRGLIVERRTNEAILRVAAEYGEDAKEEYIYKHIEGGDNKQKLEKWGDRYIKRLSSKGEVKVAGTFRAYMAAATGRQDVTLAFGDEEEGTAASTGGEASFEGIGDGLHDSIRLESLFGTNEEVGEGGEAEAGPPTEHRAEGGPTPPSKKKRKDRPATRSKKTHRA